MGKDISKDHEKGGYLGAKGYKGERGCRAAVLGIDPGIYGAFVITDGIKFIRAFEMPISLVGKDKSIPFSNVYTLLSTIKSAHGPLHVFMEKPVSFGMGVKSAFNYGRGLETLSIALQLHAFPLTLVEPSRWTKEMHEGISSDLKPKAKSLIAAQRLYPQLVGILPKLPKGAYKDGPVDALLIAGYGLRRLGAGMGTLDEKEANLGQPSARLNGASNQIVKPSDLNDDDEIGDFY